MLLREPKQKTTREKLAPVTETPAVAIDLGRRALEALFSRQRTKPDVLTVHGLHEELGATLHTPSAIPRHAAERRPDPNHTVAATIDRVPLGSDYLYGHPDVLTTGGHKAGNVVRKS